tara:strand:+ start:62 stop:244 length:183 start_codon:yes stop_codon:yes gene_type:complete
MDWNMEQHWRSWLQKQKQSVNNNNKFKNIKTNSQEKYKSIQNNINVQKYDSDKNNKKCYE